MAHSNKYGTSPPSKSFLSGGGGGVAWEDEPCLERCRSKQHGQKIWEIAQGGNEDSEVVCLWAKTCSNYSQVKDEFGRTALHAAASTGNLKAVEWLLKTQQCNINAKDFISGYTALHRSIYFGHLHVARSLIKHGADLNLRDHEGLTPFELCQMDRPITFKQNSGDMTELTVWGSNANYNLGIGHQQPRLLPDVAPEFRRTEMSLAKVEMNTYHTLFLTQSGKVYACGYGMGGRLGNGDEVTVLNPSLVHLRNNGPCRDIAVGQDHSVFLTDTKVWTVGSNEFGQLGHAGLQTNKLSNPRTVDSLQKHGITGILAGPFHSLFYNEQTVLVCGQNQGQFGRGFEKMENILVPTKLRLSFDNIGSSSGDGLITCVGGNEFCTAICVDRQYIFLLRRHHYSRIDTKNTKKLEFIKIQASGEKNSITLFLLTSAGRVLIWRENFNRATNECKGAFTRVVFSNSRLLDVKDFSVSLSSLVVIANTGEAYKAGWNCSNAPSIVGKIEERYGQRADTDYQVATQKRRGKKEDEAPPMALELIKIKRVPNVHTGLFVSSDPKGNNFAILQRHQMMDVTDIPYVATVKSMAEDITELYQEMSEDDSIHDVVFDLGSFDKFPAHRFILCAASPVMAKALQKDLKNSNNIKVSNKLFGVDPSKCLSLENPKVFRAVLDLIYSQQCYFTGSEHMLEILECAKKDGKRNGPLYNDKWKELCRFRQLCRYLGLDTADLIIQRFVSDLETHLEKHVYNNSNSSDLCVSSLDYSNGLPAMLFTRDDNFSDVVLESNDKLLFNVHKCILVARLNYFKSMFSTNWSCSEFGQSLSKGKNSDQPPKMILPFSSNAIEVLLECVYTNNADSLKEADCELICETIACSDYMMTDRLLQLAEAEMIRNITLKSAADILAFTWKHNGSQLKNTCFDFISLNLTAMLESKLLDNLSVEIIQELSAYYRSVQRNNLLISRVLEKAHGVPTSEEYQEAMKHTSEEILEQLELIVETDGASMVIKKAQNKTPRSRVRLRSRTFSESDNITESPEENSTTTARSLARKDSLRLSCSSNPDAEPTPLASPPFLRDLTPPLTPVAPEKERKLVVPLPKNRIGLNTPPQGSPIRYEEFPSLGATALPQSPPTSMLNTPVIKSSIVTCSDGSGQSWTKAKPVQSHQRAPQQAQFPLTAGNAVIVNSPAGNGGSGGKKKTKWRTLNSSPQVTKQSSNDFPSLEQQRKLTADGRDRNNPWKISSQSENKPSQAVGFKAIVEDEVEKKRNFEKATSKPLTMMQIEDEAINFLTKRYTSVETEDFIEILTVERVVTSNFSTPMWVQHPGAVTTSSACTT